MADPLNPVLYRLLCNKFGEVKIANEGCHAYVQRMPDPTNPRRTFTRASSWGEYYCVRCPFCNDHSARLWINHRYASEVEHGRRQLTNLAICYHKQCLREPGRLEQLEQLIFGMGSHLKARPVNIRPAVSAFTPVAVSPPGEIISLRELPTKHAASIH